MLVESIKSLVMFVQDDGNTWGVPVYNPRLSSLIACFKAWSPTSHHSLSSTTNPHSSRLRLAFKTSMTFPIVLRKMKNNYAFLAEG